MGTTNCAGDSSCCLAEAFVIKNILAKAIKREVAILIINPNTFFKHQRKTNKLIENLLIISMLIYAILIMLSINNTRKVLFISGHKINKF